MAEILINDIEPLDGYTAAGGETGYDYNFPIFDADDLVVLQITDAGVVTTLVRGTDYAVSGVGVADGGSIVFDVGVYPSGAPADYRYVLYRDLAVSRGTDFLTGGDFKAETVNRELDKIIMMIQQNELEIKRGLGLQKADAEDEINFEVETAAARTDKVLIFGASGNTVKAGPTSGDISTVAASIANVNLVGADIANVNTVAGISANVTTVAGIAANVTTVAGISANVTTVAGISADVTSVAAVDTDVTAVAAIDADVTAVSGITADVTTVAGISANVTTVAGISANVTTVAGITANVTTVAGISADVTTVAGDSADIQTVAANIGDVNSFANVYRIAASDPVTSLDEGDLVYNSTDNVLKYYDGAAWNSILPGITDVADDTTPQLGGSLDVNGQSIVSASNGDIPITPNGTGKIILDGLSWPTSDGNADEFLKTDGAGNLSFADLSADGRLIDVQVFTSSGTWTKPVGTNAVEVEVVGGGGGGGGADDTGSNPAAGGGGAGGTTAYSYITSGLGATETVTIGAGGTAGSDPGGGNGGAGGTSSFGAHASANGGGGGVGTGNTSSAGNGYPGGTASATGTGDLVTPGADGDNGGASYYNATFESACGGSGGNSSHGGGGRGGVVGNVVSNVTPLDGNNYGGGGGGGACGATDTEQPGGTGAGGVVIVKSYS